MNNHEAHSALEEEDNLYNLGGERSEEELKNARFPSTHPEFERVCVYEQSSLETPCREDAVVRECYQAPYIRTITNDTAL